jgi:hypothetical protein
MADAPAPITSPPARDFQPWDATADGDAAGWRKLPGGTVDLSTGQLTGDDFPDSGPWRQC